MDPSEGTLQQRSAPRRKKLHRQIAYQEALLVNLDPREHKHWRDYLKVHRQLCRKLYRLKQEL